MPKAPAGWGRAGHRRAVLIGGVVLVVVLGGGVAAWAEVGNGGAGYREATVTKADIGTSMTVVGDVDPVSDAAASFQVAGQVATVAVTPGQQVTAGQTLGTLQTTALSEAVSSAESTLAADQAKLVEDEANESTSSSSAAAAKTPTSSTTTTTAPTHASTPQSATVTQDQSTLTQDESTLSTDQNKEQADLVQAQNDCTSANTGTPAGQATCEAALQTVSSDEQQVSKDQATVSKDETALGQALGADSGTSSAGTGDPGSGSTGNSGTGSHALTADLSPAAGTGGTGNMGNTGNTGSGGGGTGSGLSGGNTDTPEQIASDQANIDSAEADLTNAQQSLNEATLNSPISGTVVSVGIDVGATVSANSSTDIITIIGTKSYEVEATLDSSQVPDVKVGQSASVEVDGVDGTVDGTVSQVGPVQVSNGAYTYPVVVALPSSTNGLFSGSTANVDITTGAVSDVVAVPTSAVETLSTRSYVLELDKGVLTRTFIKIGMVGDTYTQVLSGLSPGQSVVLADYAEAVPSSNTDSTNLGNALGGGGGGFGGAGFIVGGGPGAFNIQRTTAGAGGFGG